MRERLGADAPAELRLVGNLDGLDLPKTALFCSASSPGHTILAAYDQAARWRDEGRCVISGFHSPVEKECLRILLRGRQPVIVCLARGLQGMRLPAEWKQPLADNRLLILSQFPAAARRVTKDLATDRNRLVAALADEVVFAHVAPGGQVDELKQLVTRWGIPYQTVVG
ncbi:MAG: DNA-processing protein DprA [Deltaproteobacteria bacterium]|nr:DNA-processing protein DprA [Deltaproteobacteria bacterium]